MKHSAVPALLSLLLGSVHAAEGMWPLDRLPKEALAEHLGAPPKPEWIARLQGAAVNMDGSSGSFVSARGLVLTNHHVVSDCIDRLGSAKEDLAAKGFVAATPAQERRCPGLVARVLVGIDEQPASADCPPGEHCEPVVLYGGAIKQRYRYRRFGDVRLVMAPEAQAANFGGDDDNFAYPRFAFDFALLRVYGADGKPHRPTHWLRAAKTAPKLKDAVFVPGHPYRTERQLAVAQLRVLRDRLMPLEIQQKTHEQELLHLYATRGAEAARQALEPINSVENSLKSLKGEWAALRDAEAFAAKQREEEALRAAHPDAGLWTALDGVAQAQLRLAPAVTTMSPPNASLLSQAVLLVALREESARPEEQRLRAYRGVGLQELREELRAGRPHYPALEQVRLSGYISRAVQHLGLDHPYTRALLNGQREPGRAAAHWLSATQLQDPAERMRLLSANPRDWDASQDSLLQLARRLAPLRRPILLEHEQQVSDVLAAQSDALAKARWQAFGPAQPPDATASLRLSFGRVAEVVSGGQRQPWFSTLDGLWARADGFAHQSPFDLAPRLAALRGQLAGPTPLNFLSTADIIGGNSGSPIVDTQGDWIGVVFDGNLDSLAGRFYFDERANRALAVHQAAINLALRQLYPAGHLANELGLPQLPALKPTAHKQ